MRVCPSVGLAASWCLALASTTSPAQGQGYPPIPFTPAGMAPYPYYPPPNLTPPTYVPPPDYVPYGPSSRIPYEEGMPPPEGYHFDQSPRKDLLIQGGLVLGGTCLYSALVGATSSSTDDRWLLVPLLGPFFDIAARNQHACDSSSASAPAGCNLFDRITWIYLAVDGIAQIAGGALLAGGWIFQKKEFVSDIYGAAPRGRGIATWTVAPQIAPGSRYGLMLHGDLF